MRAETKVGFLFIATLLGIIGFALLLGIISPFSNRNSLHIMYNFAGGIEVGSPVRVMGIKVGKVTSIDFIPGYKMDSGESVQLKVTISLDKKAWGSLGENSRFYINMAGVIGEKFLEITPGNGNNEPLKPNQIVRGEDPPRIDQLISQSYGLAGKVIDLLESNKGQVVSVIQQLDSLLKNFNQTLTQLDKVTRNRDVAKLVDNSIKITDDLAYLTGKLRSKKAEESFTLLHELLFRLEDLDGKTIRQFLQKEGIKAKIF